MWFVHWNRSVPRLTLFHCNVATLHNPEINISSTLCVLSGGGAWWRECVPTWWRCVFITDCWVILVLPPPLPHLPVSLLGNGSLVPGHGSTLHILSFVCLSSNTSSIGTQLGIFRQFSEVWLEIQPFFFLFFRGGDEGDKPTFALKLSRIVGSWATKILWMCSDTFVPFGCLWFVWFFMANGVCLYVCCCSLESCHNLFLNNGNKISANIY